MAFNDDGSADMFAEKKMLRTVELTTAREVNPISGSTPARLWKSPFRDIAREFIRRTHERLERRSYLQSQGPYNARHIRANLVSFYARYPVPDEHHLNSPIRNTRGHEKERYARIA